MPLLWLLLFLIFDSKTVHVLYVFSTLYMHVCDLFYDVVTFTAVCFNRIFSEVFLSSCGKRLSIKVVSILTDILVYLRSASQNYLVSLLCSQYDRYTHGNVSQFVISEENGNTI